MTYALTIRCDGRREYIEHTVESVRQFITPEFSDKFIVDDSGDSEYAAWLDVTFPDFDCIHHVERTGLGGCFRAALEVVTAKPNVDYVFMVEDDTPLLSAIDLDAMAAVLLAHPVLSQLMLMRPPFNAEEIAAGGVFQLTPGEFTECSDSTHVWTEHNRWYGFQPNLTPRKVVECMLATPNDYLELGVTEVLKAAGYRFAYWGGISDPPRTAHVGYVRSAGYRW